MFITLLFILYVLAMPVLATVSFILVQRDQPKRDRWGSVYNKQETMAFHLVVIGMASVFWPLTLLPLVIYYASNSFLDGNDAN